MVSKIAKIDEKELANFVRQTQNTMAAAADAVKGATTRGEMLSNLAQTFLPEGAGMRLFMEWIAENSDRLDDALADLGLENVVFEGPGFAKRLRLIVTPELERLYAENQPETS